MNVKTLCLAILYDCEATGYEIRKLSTEGEYAYFVEASFGSIYPALARLEADGLVTSRVEQQNGRPAKKIYAITEDGRRAFIDSLFEDPGEDVYRSPFLLFARFAPELPADLVEERLKKRLRKQDTEIRKLQDLLKKDMAQQDIWVINYGIRCLTIAREYLADHMHELIAMAQQRTDAAAE